jgi:hypothetical protein
MGCLLHPVRPEWTSRYRLSRSVFLRETLLVVENLGLTAAQTEKAKDIISALERHVDGHINKSVERRKFRHQLQEPGENFLVSLSKFCGIECTEKNLRDQVIESLLDGDIVETLLMEKSLTLEKTIRGLEAAKRQRAEMSGNPSDSASVRRTQVNPPIPSRPGACSGCGGSFHTGGRRRCPAYNMTCRKCNRVGHMARVCRARPLQQPKQATPPPPSWQATPSTNVITVPDVMSAGLEQSGTPTVVEHAPTIDIEVVALNGSAELSILPDSGADISVAGPSFLVQLGDHPGNLLPSRMTPRAVNGTTMKSMGRLPVNLTLEGTTYTEDFHIYPEVTCAILSWKAARGLHILPRVYPRPSVPDTINVQSISSHVSPQPVSLHPTPPLPLGSTPTLPAATEMMAEFPSVFRDEVVSMEGEKFHISLEGNAKAFCVNTPRVVPYAYREKLQAELASLQSQGIIAPVTEPTDWCAPIVVAPKKGTDEIRMCVDLSKLNKYVKRERYQSPTPAEAVADIVSEEAVVFTKLDARKEYQQYLLNEESQLFNNIQVFGQFKYCKAPYGISSISEHYNRFMYNAFKGLGGFCRTVDDILIYDSNREHHAAHICTFLQRCAESRRYYRSHFRGGRSKCTEDWARTISAQSILSKDSDDVIYHNKLKLSGSTFKKSVSKGKQQFISLKSDVGLFSRLYIWSQTIDGNFDEFFTTRFRLPSLMVLTST